MATLKCLKPKMSVEEAGQMFRGGLRESRYGKLIVETGFFLPHLLFKVVARNAGAQQTQLMAIDAMTGELDLRKFDRPPDPEEYEDVESDQFGASLVSTEEALGILQDRVRRTVYQQGFFKLSDLSITGTLVERFYVLYHVAIYERKGRARFEVVDSMRGQFEGAKLRDVVVDWFREMAENKGLQRAHRK